MKAFKLQPRLLHTALTVSIIAVLLLSSLPMTAIGRTRPIEDMGDPDPTEGTNPGPSGTAKASRVTALGIGNKSHATTILTSRDQLRAYVLVFRWITWL